VAHYCSIRYCSIAFTAYRCRRSNATCGVQSPLPSRGADSLRGAVTALHSPPLH
jgi:hypothetical protein